MQQGIAPKNPMVEPRVFTDRLISKCMWSDEGFVRTHSTVPTMNGLGFEDEGLRI